MTAKFGVLISGRGSNMMALEAHVSLPEYPAEISLVLSDDPDAPGLMAARNRFLDVAVCPRAKDQTKQQHEVEMTQHLVEAGVTHLVLAGFMQILSAEFIAQWDAVFNIHPSLLPKFPGLDTHARALAANETTHGCTVHLVDEGIDTGAIIAQAALNVREEETAEELAGRVLRLEHALFAPAIQNFLQGQALANQAQGR